MLHCAVLSILLSCQCLLYITVFCCVLAPRPPDRPSPLTLHRLFPGPLLAEASSQGSTLVVHQTGEELLQLLQQGDVDYPPFAMELMRTWYSGFPLDPTQASLVMVSDHLVVQTNRVGVSA